MIKSCQLKLYISIHAPVKGATPSAVIDIRVISFQSTLPWRERLPLLPFWGIYDKYFNPRSREGSDALEDVTGTVSKNFNPRSREGSDWLANDFCQPIYISIHAPVKGATPSLLYLSPCYKISIHAPVKGATIYDTDFSKYLPISIHAPVKGATFPPLCNGYYPRNFNPRSREGSDRD